MPNEQDLQILKDLLLLAQNPREVEEGGKQIVITPPGHNVFDLEAFRALPSRKKGAAKFTRQTSFIEYVNQQKDDTSRLYVVNPTQILCVLNHHSETEEAGWGDFTATLTMTQTREWNLWTGANGRQFAQRDFAQFVEDNSDDFSSPSGAALLDMVRLIKATSSQEVVGEINETDNKDKAGSYLFQTRVTAPGKLQGAKTDNELPTLFTISIAPYEGGEYQKIDCRLKLDVCGGRLCLSYVMVKPDVVLRVALENIVDSVGQETSMTPWYGTP